MSVQLSYSSDQRVATITLNRPAQRNSLTREALSQLQAIAVELAAASHCRAVIITGNGKQTFCAGAALDQLASGELTSEEYADAMDVIAAIRQPTIALLNGNAYGGGAELALCCDFRLASEAFHIRIPPAKLGLCYPPRGLARYIGRLGNSATRQLFLSALPFDADSLLRLGFLTQIVVSDQLNERAIELAQQLAELSPQALRTMKQICNEFERPTEQQLHQAQMLADHCNQGDDLREGLSAAREKRAAQFADDHE